MSAATELSRSCIATEDAYQDPDYADHLATRLKCSSRTGGGSRQYPVITVHFVCLTVNDIAFAQSTGSDGCCTPGHNRRFFLSRV